MTSGTGMSGLDPYVTAEVNPKHGGQDTEECSTHAQLMTHSAKSGENIRSRAAGRPHANHPAKTPFLLKNHFLL